MIDHGSTDKGMTVCSFCLHFVKWKKYGKHLDKVHPGGRCTDDPEIIWVTDADLT